MAWLRKGDNAATHPMVMALAAVKDADDRLMNEVVGFVQRIAEQSAGHNTDGVIDLGTIILIGGPTRWEACAAAAVEAGLLTSHGRGKKRVWRVSPDADFIHIRPKAEIDWERQRKRDAANPELTVPVRRRDGDGCRFCGNVVNWRHRRGNRRGTYHHMRPGEPATYETYVVACFGCNNEMSDAPYEQTSKRLLPPPGSPFYGEDTVDLLSRHGVQVTPTIPRPGLQPDTAPTPRPGIQPDTAPPSRPGIQPDTAPGSRAVARPTESPASPPPSAPGRPGSQPDHDGAPPADPGHRAIARPGLGEDAEGPPTCWDLQIPADPSRSEVYGPGRGGSGQVGSGGGAPAPPPAWAVPDSRRRRARRGKAGP